MSWWRRARGVVGGTGADGIGDAAGGAARRARAAGHHDLEAVLGRELGHLGLGTADAWTHPAGPDADTERARAAELVAGLGWCAVVLAEDALGQDALGQDALAEDYFAYPPASDTEVLVARGRPVGRWLTGRVGVEELEAVLGTARWGRAGPGADTGVDLSPTASSARVALVRTGTPAEVPARLGWSGAENHSVTPLEHVSVLASWSTRFGAELVGVGPDVLELEVARPPRTAHEARVLAHELLAYCPDTVEEWANDDLLERLVSSRRWVLWWD